MTDNKESTKVGKTSTEVEKYLTEMKELSTYNKGKESMTNTKKKGRFTEPKDTDELHKKSVQPKVITQEEQQVTAPDLLKSEENISSKDGKLFSTKDILLGIINLASIALLVILLIKLPDKAQELNKLRNQVLLSESEVSFELSEIEENKGRADELEALFIDDEGLVNFVNDVENLKNEVSSISKISITSQRVVKDKTGNYGIPVVIEMRGNWTQFGNDMTKIQELPYLFRAININTEKLEEEDVLTLKYGGFLYVNDELGKD